MIVLDGTIVTVALPTIQDDLDFTQSGLSWVVNAYLIGFGGLLLLAGRFGDLFGRRRLFIIGLAVFTGASAVCGASTEPWMLVAARAVQGVGGAIMAAVAFAIVIATFTDERDRARALGIWAFVASGGGSLGVLLGGVLTASFSWHWIFLVNLPIGVAVLVLSRRLLDPDPPIHERPKVDVPGAVILVTGLALAVYAIAGAAERGWTDPVTLGLLALGVALLLVFVALERRGDHPLIPFSLFRVRSFTVANAISVLVVMGMFGWFFFAALYLQRVAGLSTLQTGLAFLPATLMMGVLSIGLSARIAMRIGHRRAFCIGLGLSSIGLLLFARAPEDASFLVDILPGQLMLGVGLGIAFMPLFMIMMSEVPPELAGLGSGVLQTVQQFGGALGLALLTALAGSRTSALEQDGAGATEALVGGYHLTFLLGGLALLGALAIGATLLPARPRAPITAGEAPAEAPAAH
jgi:EmrB/QacA subfamily drug resistance transporter